MVHTLVSPMSTCQSAPEEMPPSLPDPRLEVVEEPAEPGRLRALEPGFFDIWPALDVERFFLTRPPSLLRKSSVGSVGDAGALLASPK
jgi:hypothetical protein